MQLKKRRNPSKYLPVMSRVNRRIEIEALECRRLFNALVVTTESDSPMHTGESLRDAVVAADFDAEFGISDTITFKPGFGTFFKLSQGELVLDDGGVSTSAIITIDGASQDEIFGDGSDRAFLVDGGVNLMLNGLQISGGTAGLGGGIVNEGNLTLNSCTFYNNGATSDGGAVYNTGILNVNTSTFVGNGAFESRGDTQSGGAIYNNGGTMTISESTFNDNHAVINGGAIDNVAGGSATVSGSTFVSNTSGGDQLGGNGGGVENDGTMTVLNSTFNQNTAGGDGGGIGNSSALTVTYSTISGNTSDTTGGGLSTTGTCTLLSSVVAGNSCTDGGAVDLVGTFQATSSHNVIGDGSAEIGISDASNGNQVGSGAFDLPSADYADALAYNGGPTETMVPTSRSINQGGSVTYISGPISGTQTTIPVGFASAIASTAGNYVILVGSEQMLVTGVDLPDNTLTVVRGYDGTAAASENFGTAVYVATDQTGQLRDSAPDVGSFEYQELFSSVTPLPATETSTSFPVSWSGHPASDDAPIAYYTIYDSDNGGAYTVWLAKTTATSAIFTGITGHTYSFYSLATAYPDLYSLGEPQPVAGPPATTTIVAPAAPKFTSSSQKTFTAGVPGSFTAAASGSPAPSFSEAGALPNGVAFNSATGLFSGTPASGTVGTYALNLYAFNGVGYAATQSFKLIVAQAGTTTKLTKNTTSAVKYGQSVTFTITVSAAAANALTPGGSGNVVLEGNSTPFGTATLSNGVATFTTRNLALGANSISAFYDGDANFAASASGSLTQTVTQSATTATLTKNTTGATRFGQSVTFTAKLAAVSPGAAPQPAS